MIFSRIQGHQFHVRYAYNVLIKESIFIDDDCTFYYLRPCAAFLGGDVLVDGAVNIAKHFGMSELLIGIVLVGFGTSTPELMTSILATFEGQPGIAVGNIVGSNIANIFLILGVAALIYPIACDKKSFKRDGGFMALASLLLLGACFYGAMNIWIGLYLLP